MPIQIVLTTTAELFSAGLDVCREMSERIQKLANLDACPLTPGESPDARRHQIAKLAKKLAEAFLAIDQLMSATADHMTKHSDVTAGPVNKPDNSDAN